MNRVCFQQKKKNIQKKKNVEGGLVNVEVEGLSAERAGRSPVWFAVPRRPVPTACPLAPWEACAQSS